MVCVQGNRNSIESLAPGSCRVMESVLKLIDQHDLYGQVAYPKHHRQSDISDIYNLAAATHGVFVNPALQVSSSFRVHAGMLCAWL
jgi:sucrose-phosphate synthase